MPAKVKGPISQRELLPRLVKLIDDAQAPNSTAHRDIARSELRHLLETANWRTSFLLWNLNPRRCRYIASIGHWVPARWLSREWRTGKEPADDTE